MKKGWWGFWGYVLGSAETERAARDAYEQGYRDGRYDERCSYTENEEYIEDEDEELAETPSPVEKWVETIELFYRLAVEEKKATGRSDPWLPYRSLIPPQARSLYGYDKFKEGIEDDCLLTEDQERRLLKLLNKRRKAIIESVKRRTMDTDSKRNIIEEHGTLLKKMLGDNNLKMSDKLSWFSDCRRYLKYNPCLTEGQMSELGRLIDNYIEEAEKTSKENNATEKVKKTGIRSRVLLGIAGAALLCILCVKLYVILPNTLPWISKAFVSFVPIFIWTAFILIGIVRLKKVTKVRLDESVDKT